ncbi:MAG: GNAT family N-acetyltransferase [Smithella sp.]
MNIIKSIEETFFANCRYWGSLNSSTYNSGSIWAMRTDIESADLNMVWNEKPLTVDDGKTIQDIKNHFRKNGLPFWWWVFPGAQSQMTNDMLRAEGFAVVDSIPSLYTALNTLYKEQRDERLQIIQVGNQDHLALWEEVSFAGFDFPLETRQQYHRFTTTFNLNPDSPQKLFLALWNEKPVATLLLFLHESAGGIYFVCTLAEHRRKGIGLALMQATLRYARQAGARFATLQSSPDGMRVYQQAGFKEYCRVDVYSLAANI